MRLVEIFQDPTEIFFASDGLRFLSDIDPIPIDDNIYDVGDNGHLNSVLYRMSISSVELWFQ